MTFDAKQFGEHVALRVKALLAPVLARLDNVEKAMHDAPTQAPKDGISVKDARIHDDGTLRLTLSDGSTLNAGTVRTAPPEVDVNAAAIALARCDEVKTMVDLIVSEAVEEQVADYVKKHAPKGDKGQDAVVNMQAIVDAVLGTSPFIDQIAKGVERVALAYLEAHPAEKGDSGVGVAGAMISKQGNLIVTTSDGRVHDLGLVVGRDGLGIEDATARYEDGKVTLSFTRGDLVKEVSFNVPTMKHLGFYQEGLRAGAGNTTTHNGSLWIAKRATEQTPSLSSDDWQLAARKGADGAKAPTRIK